MKLYVNVISIVYIHANYQCSYVCLWTTKSYSCVVVECWFYTWEAEAGGSKLLDCVVRSCLKSKTTPENKTNENLKQTKDNCFLSWYVHTFYKFAIAVFARSFLCDKRSSNVEKSWHHLNLNSKYKEVSKSQADNWDLSGQFHLQGSLCESSISGFLNDPSSPHQKMQLPSISDFILICLILSDTKYTMSFLTLSNSPDLWHQWASNNWICSNPEVNSHPQD